MRECCLQRPMARAGGTNSKGRGEIDEGSGPEWTHTHLLTCLQTAVEREKHTAEDRVLSRHSDTSAISRRALTQPGLFNHGRSCWLRFASQQYTLYC